PYRHRTTEKKKLRCLASQFVIFCNISALKLFIVTNIHCIILYVYIYWFLSAWGILRSRSVPGG
ncbi:MAG: hypothetical protein WBM86_08820, partial [Waterburya sp.]